MKSNRRVRVISASSARLDQKKWFSGAFSAGVSSIAVRPWKFSDNQGRLSLEFTPFKERLAQTDLKLIFSEVHQMFGRYNGRVRADSGEEIQIVDLVGFAEEHHARW